MPAASEFLKRAAQIRGALSQLSPQALKFQDEFQQRLIGKKLGHGTHYKNVDSILRHGTTHPMFFGVGEEGLGWPVAGADTAYLQLRATPELARQMYPDPDIVSDLLPDRNWYAKAVQKIRDTEPHIALTGPSSDDRFQSAAFIEDFYRQLQKTDYLDNLESGAVFTPWPLRVQEQDFILPRAYRLDKEWGR